MIYAFCLFHLLQNDATALAYACKGEYLLIVSALLKAGADPNIHTKVVSVCNNLQVYTTYFYSAWTNPTTASCTAK